jgi:LAO/AO transport system kinase
VLSSSSNNNNDITRALLNGERWAVAKAISIVENDTLQARELVESIFKHIGNSRVIGVTGPAGAGKSTLIGKIISTYRARGFKVGVIAVDPSSSISGGAILGDRVRMQEHALDDGTYIRSMASRGALGGLSLAVRDAIKILDVAGFQRIIVESVGAGQLDVKIASIADVTVVVFNPQTGDSIQAIKAGLTEIGNIYVVNKADLSGANALYNDIKSLIVDERDDAVVVKTVATTGKGVNELVDAIESILSKMEKDYKLYKEMERRRIEAELKDIVFDMLINLLYQSSDFNKYVDLVARREIDPYKAAESIVKSKIRG